MKETLIVLTRRIPPAGMAVLEEAGVPVRVVENDPTRHIDVHALRDAVRDADVLITLLTERIDSDVMNAAPRLRGVANMAVGYNNIDIAAANAMGIPVSNTPGVLTDTTADLTWALLLGIARRIVEADAYMRGGNYRMWSPELMLGADVGPGAANTPRTLGIIGYGRIGRAVARRASGFDMRVVAYNPGRSGRDPDGTRYVSLDELLGNADFVTIHTPGGAATHHLIGAREIALMKPSAYLVNVARGDVVDEAALVDALRERRIAGAALDVFENEPAMAPGLAQCENVIVVPHIGSASHDTRAVMATRAAVNALAHLRRERAPDAVNPQVYDTDSYARRIRG